MVLWGLLLGIVFRAPDTLILHGIQLQGNPSLALQSLVDSLVQEVQDAPLTDSLVDAIFTSIRTYYQYRGFAFPQLQLLRFDGPPHALKMVLYIRPGPFVLIRRFHMVGLRITRPGIIERRLQHWIGKPLRPGELLRDIQEIQRMLSHLSLKNWHFDQTGVLTLEFHDAPSNVLSLSLGMNSSGTLVGLAELQAQNLLGTGRKLFLSWKRLSVNDQWWAAQYLEPWLLNSRFYLILSADFSYRRDLFFRQEQGAELGLMGTWGDLEWGGRRSFRQDYVMHQRLLDWMSTFRMRFRNFSGFSGEFLFLGGRTLREWQGGLSLESRRSRWFSSGYLQPYFKIHQVTRTTGLTQADLFPAGGMDGPLGVPESSLLLRNLWVAGIRFGIHLVSIHPFVLIEMAKYKTWDNRADLKSWALGWTQTWGSQQATVLMAWPWGTPWLEGWLSFRLQTRF